MVFCTGFDMGIHQKLLIVTIVALKSCPSFKLVLGHFALGQKETLDSESNFRPVTKYSQTQSSVETKRRTTPFEAGYTEYQP